MPYQDLSLPLDDRELGQADTHGLSICAKQGQGEILRLGTKQLPEIGFNSDVFHRIIVSHSGK